MPTRVEIDDELLEQARRLGGHATKTTTVTEALRGYVQRRRQASIVSVFGTIDFEPGYDHRALRRRR